MKKEITSGCCSNECHASMRNVSSISIFGAALCNLATISGKVIWTWYFLALEGLHSYAAAAPTKALICNSGQRSREVSVLLLRYITRKSDERSCCFVVERWSRLLKFWWIHLWTRDV